MCRVDGVEKEKVSKEWRVEDAGVQQSLRVRQTEEARLERTVVEGASL